MIIPLLNFKRIFILVFTLSSFLFVNNSFSQDIDLGESLFKTNCASCHYLGPEDKKLIGPGLDEEIFDEHTEEWLFKWIRNSAELIESGDKVANELYEEYNKAVMTPFPHFSDDDIVNILGYIQKGPPEISEDISVLSQDQDTSSSNTLLYLILVIITFNICLLIYVKNTLKTAAGIQKESFFISAVSWIKLNPSVIVFVGILVIFSGMKGCWNSLSTIGVAQNYQPEQPIAFSHKIHSGDNGIDCNYCHHTARSSKHAGIPSVNVCMNCHTYINEGTTTGTKEINKIYAAVGFDPASRTYIPNFEQKTIVSDI